MLSTNRRESPWASPAKMRWRSSLFATLVMARASGQKRRLKELQVRAAFRLAQDEQGQLPRVVVAPHRRFPARDLPARRDVVPPVGAVVDGVQQEALVSRVRREVGFREERPGYRQPGLA